MYLRFVDIEIVFLINHKQHSSSLKPHKGLRTIHVSY